MKQLYFIRHGLSELNVQGAMAGHTDTPLVLEGHEQAKRAGKKAKEADLSFDIIISSPLQRAHHTAQHIAAAIDYPQEKIELNDLFKERGYGQLEGADAKTALVADYFNDESVIDHLAGVETLQELQQRADRALRLLAVTRPPDRARGGPRRIRPGFIPFCKPITDYYPRHPLPKRRNYPIRLVGGSVDGCEAGICTS